MAQRNETAQRKLVMLRDLRDAALSQRELSARYGLSGHTISLLMQQLVEEGVLYTVPRIGTFLGRPPVETLAPYIFVSDVARQFNTFVNQMQAGFYDRVAQLGAAAIILSIEKLGLHANGRNSEIFYWSAQCKAGWHQMMQNAGQNTEGLLFLPEVSNSCSQLAQREIRSQLAVWLIGASHATAVIAANFFVSESLLKTLRQAAVPIEHWPAIVCFDEATKGNSIGVSYLRLPWEKIGSEAAQLLWERKTERTKGVAQRHLVKSYNPVACRTNFLNHQLSGPLKTKSSNT